MVKLCIFMLKRVFCKKKLKIRQFFFLMIDSLFLSFEKLKILFHLFVLHCAWSENYYLQSLLSKRGTASTSSNNCMSCTKKVPWKKDILFFSFFEKLEEGYAIYLLYSLSYTFSCHYQSSAPTSQWLSQLANLPQPFAKKNLV